MSESWSGRIGFICATVGSAVGLGSIWKFPYEVGSNGGGAFVVFYALGLVLIVVPLMLAEFAIGRRGRADAIGSIASVAQASAVSRHWAWAGSLGVATAFLILSFYSVIGGWALAYALDTMTLGLAGANAAAVQSRFDSLLASPVRLTAFHAVFMTTTAVIVARGVAGGVEQASKILMPVLIILVTALAGFSVAQGGFTPTLRFMFALDINTVTPRVALEALGLGFFSIGIGMAVMITYAAYAGAGIDLKQVAIITILGDTAISLMAGFAVFPVVFAEKLDPASGPGLMFVTLPLAFARIPLGAAAAVAFFLLLVIAALASAISLLEMPVAMLRRRLGWSRPHATAIAATTCWTVGLATVLSFNVWAGWFPAAAVPGFARATVFDLMDHFTSNLLLPAAGLALALFAGWAIPARVLADELKLSPWTAAMVRMLLRYVAPAGILGATLGPLLT